MADPPTDPPLARIVETRGRLRKRYGELAAAWAELGDIWADERRRRFERDHLAELGPMLARLSAALEAFEEIVRDAERRAADDDAPRGGW